ncbi:MAG: MmgE/PrpD family protein [Chloroflexota bacterium]
MGEMSLTEELVSWLIKTKQNGFSEKALAYARYYLTDWLGSTIGGHRSQPGRIVLNYAAKQPTGTSGIVGTSLRVSAESAALVNGSLSHIVEMDDLHRRSVVHPGAVVVPAALAIAEREGCTGQELLCAIVAGYEVVIRIGEAVGKRHYYYFHNTATCGVFGAAAATGWLLGLNNEQLVWSLGNAGTQAAGLWQFNADGDMSKHLHAGMAAADGVRAAELALLGLTGPREILEGDRGFFAATAPDAEPSVVLDGLGSEALRIGTVSIKPHASCRHTHPAIDAALALRDDLSSQGVTDNEIEHYRLTTYQAALDLCDNPSPQSPYAAKFSLQYCIAIALMWGEVGLAEFDPERIDDPAIPPLLSKIHLQPSSKYEVAYPAQWPAHLQIVLRDGSSFSHEVLHPKGDPENNLSLSELEAKFCQLAQFANSDPEPWLEWVYALNDSAPVLLRSSNK